MKAERWQQVESLFQSALEVEPSKRAAFLDRECVGDELLRGEVKSLIKSFEQSESFIEEPAFADAADLLVKDQAESVMRRPIGNYRVLSRLGAGGMGEVYLAQDTKLGRRVALKVLPAYFTQDESRVHRFQQEARAASALNHPNILTIHEIGQVDGRHFIATEFIDGETLRERMRRMNMKLSEVLDISTQVASALAAAHEVGIVHRDIKPENIMLRSDGYIKVLDFGLAKLVELASDGQTTDSEALTKALVNTEAGMIMGTASFMSPEQARGQAVDARTDIWSLGVVLYEMVTGRAPFEGATPSHVIVALMEKEPPPLTTLVPEAPAELDRIVTKALMKEREERYQTAKDLSLDLKSLKQELEVEARLKRSTRSDVSSSESPVKSGGQAVAETTHTAARTADVDVAHPTSSAEYIVGVIRRRKVVATVALVVLATLVIAGVFLARPLLTWWFKPPSIAVLPLVNATGDPNNNYISDGLTESLITSLNQINEPGKRPRLLVTAQGTVSIFRGKEIEPRSIGRELGVDTVLASQMLEQNGLWIIKVEMINVANGSEMWRKQYSWDGHFTDAFLTMQDEIAKGVAGKLPLSLSDAERQRLTRRYTQNPAAYAAYLKGRASWFKTTPEGYRKSIEYYQQAIDLDPNFALPYWGMGTSISLQAKIGLRPEKEAVEKATEMYLKALQIDNTLRAAKGGMELAELESWNWEAIEKAGPSHQGYHFFHGGYLIAMGRLDEQLAFENRGLAFQLYNPGLNFFHGETLFLARQYDASIAQYQKTLDIVSRLPPEYSGALVNWIHSGLGQVYLQKGMFPEAITEFNKARDLTEDLPPAWEDLGYAYAKSGQRDEAIKILNQLQERAKRGEYVLPLGIAWIYIGLGDKDQAFVWLDKSFEERSDGLRQIKTNPIYDPLRSDPRFTDLLKRMHLPT
jgi:eukaryotic-like serine/threonine-protein kinase